MITVTPGDDAVIADILKKMSAFVPADATAYVVAANLEGRTITIHFAKPTNKVGFDIKDAKGLRDKLTVLIGTLEAEPSK